MSKTHNEPIIGITIGDINGISTEVIIKSLLDPKMCDFCTIVIYGSAKSISYYKKALNAEKFKYNLVSHIDKIHHKAVNVINCWDEEVMINIGKEELEKGNLALRALDSACYDLKNKKIDGIVTAPLNKNTIRLQEGVFTGHTGYIASKFNTTNELMFMISDNLRVGLVTGHIPVSQVSQHISEQKIANKLLAMIQSLKRDFLIDKPKIAVLGLNPHASDNSLIGNEEETIIIPAIKKIKAQGHFVFGPYSSDGFFAKNSYTQFDAVLAMYHDQGLIPFKTIANGTGVNLTAGLPIVRTSPDHGTAFDIAGKNIADETSMRQAIYMCLDVIRNRKNYAEMHANPIEKVKLEREIQPEEQ